MSDDHARVTSADASSHAANMQVRNGGALRHRALCPPSFAKPESAPRELKSKAFQLQLYRNLPIKLQSV
jgi:hypothetical protein